MRRLVLPKTCDPLAGNQSIRIEGKQSRYIARVLRMGEGDTFPGIDEEGREFQCTILEAGRDFILLGLEAEPVLREKPARTGAAGLNLAGPASGDTGSREPGSSAQTWENPAVILVQGLPKAGKMDLIVRQATEMGVTAIIPLLSRHCVSRPEKGDESENRRDRWVRIVREAMQQSGSPIATEILPISTPEELASVIPEILKTRGDCEWLGLLLHESRPDTPSLHQYCAGNPAVIALCIGPEGGFAREEVALLENLGFRVAHLRVPVLRTETAAIYAVAAIKTITTERDAWNPA